jgi:phosphate transport system permease protein
MKKNQLEERFFMGVMLLSCGAVAGGLGAVSATVIIKGLAGLSWELLTQTPKGGFYLGKEGGILNAIAGSLCLALGATALAALIALPIALYLEIYKPGPRRSRVIRLSLDVMWGIPSIVYGAFGFTVMMLVGRASLLGGILTLTLLELPIMVRAMDEVTG